MLRWAVLNEISKIIGAENYLEVGTCSGETFCRVQVPIKWAVDPILQAAVSDAASYSLEMKSDDFFASKPDMRFDLVFIDAWHEAEQLYRDVLGALSVLTPKGIIVMHDCNPTTEAMQIVPMIQGVWTGDCWKAVARLRSEGEHSVRVINTDYGIGVVVPRRREQPIELEKGWLDLVWSDLEAHREQLLGLQDVEEFFPWFIEVVNARK